MRKETLTIGLFVLLLAVASTTAVANDQIISTVTIPAGQQRVPDIVNNGVPSGTIQLWYSYIGTSFPCGQFAQFNLGLVDMPGTSGRSPSYPVDLGLVQSGNGTPVQFFSNSPVSPNPALFTVSGPGWSSSSLVTVFIDCSQLSAPADGQDIVGNLNEQTNPQGAHLDTISTIQVHIKLVFPTACLKLYSFESDQDTGVLLSSVVVNANKFGSVRSTSPGSLSVDALVVNTCPSPQSFDLAVGLDSDWETVPNNNPGNATFTYMEIGEVDPSTYSLAAFGTGTPQGEKLCLTNVTVPAGDSLLTRVHSAIVSVISVGSLPGDGDFDFSAALYTANTSCSGALLGTSIVDPSNPASSVLTYTVH
jgi:hypothetical protein